MTPETTRIPETYFEACDDGFIPIQMAVRSDSLPATVGSFDFLLGQAIYFAWPELTLELLAATLVHENAHHSLSLATSLGHLLLHLKFFFHHAFKSPGFDRVAKDVMRYLDQAIRSCLFCQESDATMSAYAATFIVYGESQANEYLRAHGDPNSPTVAPYTYFVMRALELFRKHGVPPSEWSGYFRFMASVAMNVDIDRLMEAMTDFTQFQALCSSPSDSADGRFRSLFTQLENLILEGGPASSLGEELRRHAYRQTRMRSSGMAAVIAASLAAHLPNDPIGRLEAEVLDAMQRESRGFGDSRNIETLFIASQPDRPAKEKTYYFRLEDALAATADLVEMGIAGSPHNVKLGGVNINFFWTATPSVHASFSVVHPCFANRGKDLLNGKTLVVYYSVDFELAELTQKRGAQGSLEVESILQLAGDKPIIYLFYGEISKLLRWIGRRHGKLHFAALDIEQPPVRFIIFSETTGADNRDLLVLPVAPVPNRFLTELLSDIPEVSVDVVAGTPQRRAELEKFIRWFVFAPVT